MDRKFLNMARRGEGRVPPGVVRGYKGILISTLGNVSRWQQHYQSTHSVSCSFLPKLIPQEQCCILTDAFDCGSTSHSNIINHSLWSDMRECSICIICPEHWEVNGNSSITAFQSPYICQHEMTLHVLSPDWYKLGRINIKAHPYVHWWLNIPCNLQYQHASKFTYKCVITLHATSLGAFIYISWRI